MDGFSEGKTLQDHRRLYQAAKTGDWKTAKEILGGNPDYVRQRITTGGETVLHIAAAEKHTLFVKKLVEMLGASDLLLKDDRGCTALYHAVTSGVVENAKVMIKKNSELLTIRTYDEISPIQYAALLGHKEMVSHLYKTYSPFAVLPYWEIEDFLKTIILNDMYDVALDILKKERSLAFAEFEGNQCLLNLLVRKLQALTDEKEEWNWGKFIGAHAFTKTVYKAIQEKSSARKKAYELLETIWVEYRSLPACTFKNTIRSQEILHYAAKEGNAKFLDMILQRNPDLLWELNEKGQSILHVAVLHRQEKVVHYIRTKQGYKDFITLLEDNDRNNILHLAAMTATTFLKDQDGSLSQKEKKKVMPQSLPRLSTAALQYEREISWFKEMEKMVPNSFRDRINKNDKTPKQLFAEEHISLRIEGENSIRDTASSCMLVATLIATVAFAAAFTVPGGNSDATGIPNFIKQTSFTVFTISDAVGMIYSMVSIVMFLSILILRYTEDNFHVALSRLLFGLGALCVSVGGMLVAFTAAFFAVYNKAWQSILIAVFAGVPVVLFLSLNSELWFDSISSLWRNVYLRYRNLKLGIKAQGT
ncbi:protein ACCELERATED CELL DEATH 6-like isoform X2 [Ipomoea triloba]|uniref:protein ACCELERATED CELL DEATH 6-like isoform X2 n=1 Tax=Ipomoea triloba TaxID=35885 RepID=UPI00125E4458|nr:protein ACCELERATED CELL DEATH 6-like isoform X2 [Ipomoea triloba]